MLHSPFWDVRHRLGIKSGKSHDETVSISTSEILPGGTGLLGSTSLICNAVASQKLTAASPLSPLLTFPTLPVPQQLQASRPRKVVRQCYPVRIICICMQQKAGAGANFKTLASLFLACSTGSKAACPPFGGRASS